MLRIYLLILIFPLLIFSACNTGNDPNIILNGRILNAAQLGSIIVSIIEDNRTRDSADVNPDGTFQLNFNSSTGSVTIEFETDTFTAQRQNFSVTDNSRIELEVTINQNPISIVFNNWDVFQDPISINNEDEVVFVDTEADFFINGDGNNCIRTNDSSLVSIEANSIDISNCDEGVRAEGNSAVNLLTNESLRIFSNSNGIRGRNESIVSIGQTTNPTNNSVEVRSFDADGVNTSETAEVIFTPQNNNCTIRGANSAVNEGSNSMVDTDGCTLVDG
ncbi:MAG: hypothetical protein ACR2NW_05615 [Thermodesulfobacteriota bacterium]